MEKRKNKFQDWMTIITYAEAGEPEMGFRIAGFKAPWRKKVDKVADSTVKLNQVVTDQ